MAVLAQGYESGKSNPTPHMSECKSSASLLVGAGDSLLRHTRHRSGSQGMDRRFRDWDGADSRQSGIVRQIQESS